MSENANMTVNESTEEESVRYLTLQFLDWIALKPRSYQDVMDAWRTSCPRLPVWEEAISRGLVKREGGPSLRHAMVSITEAGRAMLQTAIRCRRKPGGLQP